MHQVVTWLQALRGPVEPDRADLIEAHGWRAGWRARALARRVGRPLIVVVHAYPPAARTGRALWWGLERGLRPAPAGYVAVSRPLARWLRPRLSARIRVVPLVPPRPEPLPAAEARAVLGVGEGVRLVGSIGRLIPDKGFDVLLQAWARLPGALRDGWRLVLIGDGPERRRLAHQAARLGIAGGVIWAGAVPDAGRLAGAFDLYVQASRREGLGLAALEAAAAGVPAVLTRAGGLAEVARLGASAVPPGDPAALAAALAGMLALDPQARRRAGDAFRRRAAACFPQGAGPAALTAWYAEIAGAAPRPVASP